MLQTSKRWTQQPSTKSTKQEQTEKEAERQLEESENLSDTLTETKLEGENENHGAKEGDEAAKRFGFFIVSRSPFHAPLSQVPTQQSKKDSTTTQKDTIMLTKTQQQKVRDRGIMILLPLDS